MPYAIGLAAAAGPKQFATRFNRCDGVLELDSVTKQYIDTVPTVESANG